MTPEERLRRQQLAEEDSGLGSKIFKAGEAAFVVGAGAAFLSRSHALPHIMRGLSTAGDIVSRLGDYIPASGLRDMNIDDARIAARNIKRDFKKNAYENRVHPIKIDLDKKNLISTIQSVRSTLENTVVTSRERYRHNVIIAAGRKEIDNIASAERLTDERRNKYEQFIAAASKNLNNRENIFEVMRSTGLQDDPFTDRILAKMREEAQSHGTVSDDDAMKKLYEESDSFIKSAIEQYLNPDKLEKELGSDKTRTSTEEFLDKLLGRKRVTVGDLLDNEKELRKKTLYVKKSIKTENGAEETKEKYEQEDLYKFVKDIYDSMNEKAQKKFRGIYVDKDHLFKGPDGEIYSDAAISNVSDKFLEFGAGTLPGQILKLRDIQYSRRIPVTQYIYSGSIDPYLANRLGSTDNGARKKEVANEYFRINDTLYEMTKVSDKNGNEKTVAREVKGLEDVTWVQGRFGGRLRLYRQMMGDTPWHESDNMFMRYFDIGQARTEPSVFSKLKSVATKYNSPEWRGNRINSLIHPADEEREKLLRNIIDTTEKIRKDGRTTTESDDMMYQIYEYISKVNHAHAFIDRNARELSKSALSKIETITSGKAKDIAKALQKSDDEEMLDSLITAIGGIDGSNMNKNLTALMNSIKYNYMQTKNIVELRNDPTGLNVSSSLFDTLSTKGDNEAELFGNKIRKEASKELLLQIGNVGTSKKNVKKIDFNKIFELLDVIDFNKKEYNEVHDLAALTVLENKVINKGSGHYSAEELLSGTPDLEALEKAESAYNLFVNSDERADKETVNAIGELAHSKISSLEAFEKSEVEEPLSYNTTIAMHKVITPLDIIRDINKGTFKKALKTTQRMFTQLAAGRDDVEDITSATFIPYFMLSRLSDALNVVGLGFSKENMKSVYGLAFAGLTKRALPIMIGSTYLEWADDTSEEITGKSMSGALASGVANVDIASRRVLDTFGITDWLKDEKRLNPIMQYWGDRDDFQNAEERYDYYAKGYTPVRRGAWWTFGGVNEARGADIQYWEPTFARRINSDYEDKSLYDGYFDKWSHSLLPTPSNPLSPIFGLLDPYWLEDKHEDDRPYAVSGPLFTTGTPWGSILNATIGKIIKPQEELHPWRLRHGIDVKNLIGEINDYIKDKAHDLGNSNLIQIKNGSATAVSFSAFNAPSEDTKVLSLNSNNGTILSGGSGTYGVYDMSEGQAGRLVELSNLSTDRLMDIGESDIPSFRDRLKMLIAGDGNGKYLSNRDIIEDKNGVLAQFEVNGTSDIDDSIDLKDELSLDMRINKGSYFNTFKSELREFVTKHNPKDFVRSLNQAEKARAYEKVKVDEQADAATYAADFDEDQGFLTPEKIGNYRPSYGMNLLEHPEDIAELVSAGKGYDFVRDASISWRLVTGIYGYMAGELTGYGVDDRKQVATSSDMTSFSRTFWDSNLGGAGGDVMEIFRRFIPDFRRGIRVNPLKNEMPDWMPDRFKFGDPYTAIPKGEMRLPGEGYKSINQLHPDAFGEYGAFDRYKILADVAPNSPEYKLWKKIAQKTVTDPNLIEEMDDIRTRVAQQTKKHDFYEYNVVGRGVEYRNVVVSDVYGYGKFRSGNTIYKLAGVKVRGNDNENAAQVLGRYIHPGDSVTIAVDENSSYRNNRDTGKTVNAAVFVDDRNIGQEMMANGDAVKRKGDTSAAATLANYTTAQKAIGYVSEVIAHADVPWLNDQFLRVRTPLESYKAEQVYGVPYQSWSHPIDSFFWPAVERSIHERSIIDSITTSIIRKYEDDRRFTPIMKKAGVAAWVFSNRGAFMGGAISQLFFTGNGSKYMKGAYIGSSLISAGHFIAGGSSYLDEMASGADIGQEVARFFKKSRVIGAAIGAAAGTVYRTIKQPKGEWIPERTKKRWQLEDYFDRLTYIKYMGLYHEAARRAEEEEGVNVEALMNRHEKREEERQNALSRFKGLKNALRSLTPRRDPLVILLNKKIHGLEEGEDIIGGGEYTHSAIIYKQAAEATMYGLTEKSSWSQIITALSKNDREYFMEFVKEQDKDKRQEILKYVSPALKRALNIAWGKGDDKPTSNAVYFAKKPLPKVSWAGWRPDVDLKDVEIKTIENEGMNLSDFGFYESSLKDRGVRNAPSIRRGNSSSGISLNLHRVLSGAGLKNVEVNVTERDKRGTQIIADIGIYSGMRRQRRIVEDSMMQGIQ